MVITKEFTINGKTIKVLTDGETVKINELVFNDIHDFVYFVNKLTDLAEELLEGEKNGDI